MTQATQQVQATWQGDDFPTWLSPIIVKELRQGLQSGVFSWTLIGLQAAMFLILTFGFTLFKSVTSGPGRIFIDNLFWTLLGVGVLLIIPLRGLTVISAEQVGNKLDLLMLTRLSATKMVVGKWLAIAAQGLLVVISFLPYVVLRYFFGNVEVISELTYVGWLYLFSTLIAALSLALSGLPIWARIGIGAVLLLGVLLSIDQLAYLPPSLFSHLPTILGTIAAMAIYTLTLLVLATSKLAPISENHTMRKRLIALGIGLAWLCASRWGSSNVATLVILATLPIVIFLMLAAVLERPVRLKSHAEGFAKVGLLGRLAAQLLTPGWHSGIVFVLTMTALCLPALWKVAPSWPSNPRIVWMAYAVLTVAAILFPLPLIARFPRLRYQPLGYAFVHILSLLAFSFTYSFLPHGLKWREWETAWTALTVLPVASIASLIACSSGSSQEVIADTSIVVSCVVTGIVCTVVLRPWLKEMRETNRLLTDAKAARRLRTVAPRIQMVEPQTSMGVAE